MLSKLLYRINIALVFISLFAYLSPYVDIVLFWPISLLGLLYPVLLLLNIGFILFWAFKKEKKIFLSLGWLILGWTHFHALVGFSIGHDQQGEEYMEVLSYNCRGFSKDNQRKEPIPYDEIFQFLNEQKIQIACLQEFPSGKTQKPDIIIDKLTKNTLLKHSYHLPQSGLLILSKFPIKDIKTKHFSKKNHFNGYQYADITLGNNQIVRVFNIHLQTNAVTYIAGQLAKKESYQDKETWLTIKGMMGRYRRSAIHRIAQAKEIQTEIEKSPYPVIACGDFNDVPLSRAYHLLKGKLNDGFAQKGRGIGISFAESIPGLKIDYNLFSSEFKCSYSRVHHVLYSDHYPISARLKLKAK